MDRVAPHSGDHGFQAIKVRLIGTRLQVSPETTGKDEFAFGILEFLD